MKKTKIKANFWELVGYIAGFTIFGLITAIILSALILLLKIIVVGIFN